MNKNKRLEESKTPDATLIEKFFKKANGIIKAIGVSSEISKSFKGLLDTFGISF